MDDPIKITLPKLGESIVSATVVRWFKKIGDSVALDEPLLEVSTDKVNSEIPSPVAGILQEIFAHPDQELPVGGLLGVIGTKALPPAATEEFFSPSVMRLLKERGISDEEIGCIPRSGQGGRLTRKDVEDYKKPCDVERIKMSPLRKAVAENMVRSFYEAPHASLITEVDVTHLVKAIQENKESFVEKHGAKLTITSFVAQAIARAVHAFPFINASLEEGDTIAMKRSVHLGIAVSVDQGVVVPVIRNCHHLSLPEIAKQVAALAEKARNRRLAPEEMEGGTLTMTNFGMTGTLIGVPIIRHPEVAIVGLGAIAKKVVPVGEDAIGIRSIMWVSLTFDHRVLDGLYGCGFLSELKKHLEEPFKEIACS